MLEEILPAFLHTRPWFRGRRGWVTASRVTDAVPLGQGDGALVATLVTVEYASGEPETYVVPLAFVPKTDARVPTADVVFAFARLGTVEGVLVDALDDAASAHPLLDAMIHGARVAGSAGEIVGTAFEPGLEEDGGGAKSLGSKHSNAAIQYGGRFMLKVYRRLEPGRTPELDAGRLLSKQAPGLAPQFVGAIEYRSGRAEPSTVAVLQRFVPNEGTAWDHACAEVGRFYERVLASHDEPELPPPPQGALAAHAAQTLPAGLTETMSAYCSVAQLLGTRTADMHVAFASSDDPAFAPEPFSSLDRRSTYQSFRNLIGRVVRELRVRRTELPAQTLELAQQVVDRERAILDRIAPLLHAGAGGLRIRIHGDYHLGQVLHTGKDFVVLDFDGDARTSLSERRRKRSALRDVAQMVRSFRYAAHAARTRGVVREEDQARLQSWEQLWAGWTAAEFLRGYFERAGGAPFLPATEEGLAMLLDRHVLARALHELQDWTAGSTDPIAVPLADILRMLDE